MSLIEILFLSIGVAMDAMAVSISKGVALSKFSFRRAYLIGIVFGLFQVIMPFLGYLLGMTFYDFIERFDHFVIFGLLFFIGISMIKESSEEKKYDNNLDFGELILLGIATSIDALAIGVTFALLEINIIFPLISIGIITFVLSFLGVILGCKVGNKLGCNASIIGGVILIFIGLKTLILHIC